MSTITKVTMKDSKKTIGEFLASTIKAVQKKDKNLFDRMKYTSTAYSKDENSVTKSDLFELAEEVMNLFATPVAAEEIKPKSETALKKSGTAKSNKAEEKTADEKKADKKSDKKTEKKSDPKASLNVEEYVTEFPETIERNGEVYERADDIKSLKAMYKEIEKGTDFVMANFYSKRMLIQKPYGGGLIPAPKDGFEDDLDIADVLYVADDGSVAYSISQETHCLYMYLANELTRYDEYGARFSNCMEYELYRVVKTNEDEEEDEDE